MRYAGLFQEVVVEREEGCARSRPHPRFVVDVADVVDDRAGHQHLGIGIAGQVLELKAWMQNVKYSLESAPVRT